MDLLSATHEIADVRINIYPNTVTDVISIDVDGNLDFLVSLYNMKGQLIQTSKSKISVSLLDSGVYLLEIKDINSGQKIVERILIEK